MDSGPPTHSGRARGGVVAGRRMTLFLEGKQTFCRGCCRFDLVQGREAKWRSLLVSTSCFLGFKFIVPDFLVLTPGGQSAFVTQFPPRSKGSHIILCSVDV